MNDSAQGILSARALLVIVSAPAGAGKSTLCDMLIHHNPSFSHSISCTTRLPRGAEKDGVHYHFLTEDDFKKRLERDEFLEHAVVHGHHYGTLKKTVIDELNARHDIIMDIDVQGAESIRQSVQCGEADPAISRAFVDIFISAPSMEELERRIRTRGEDSEESIQRRMKNAIGEMACMPRYKYHIVNEDLESSFKTLQSIIESEKCGTES
jgi:guanylate kinase